MSLLPNDSRCLCQSNSNVLVGFKLTICYAMQARQSLKEERKKKFEIDKNFEKPKVTMNYCDRILNFEPDIRQFL